MSFGRKKTAKVTDEERVCATQRRCGRHVKKGGICGHCGCADVHSLHCQSSSLHECLCYRLRGRGPKAQDMTIDEHQAILRAITGLGRISDLGYMARYVPEEAHLAIVREVEDPEDRITAILTLTTMYTAKLPRI